MMYQLGPAERTILENMENLEDVEEVGEVEDVGDVEDLGMWRVLRV